MSLLLPPFQFMETTDNLHRVAAPSATPGQNFTAGANNADGAVVNLSFANRADNGTVTALEFDTALVVIGIGGINNSGNDPSTLLDLMVDPSGGTSYASLADDLVCGFSATPNNLGITLAQFYAFPLCIKAGSSLGIQARNASASSLSAGRCAVWLYGRPSRPDSWWCGTKVESLGVVPATSKGANHTPGNGAWSAFGTIGTSTYRYRAVQFGFNGTDSVALAINTHWEIGHGSTRLPGAPRFHTSMSTSETATRHGFGVPIFCDVAASTTWQCRGWGSGAGEVNTVALYGVY